MELRELQFFVVSVDAGSLSQAAQILYTTQPHVSKTIKKLERTLGYQLLERSKKGVELTKEGEKVYDQARKMLSSMEEIQRIQMETQESTIRIASMPSSLLKNLPHFLQNFRNCMRCVMRKHWRRSFIISVIDRWRLVLCLSPRCSGRLLNG